MSDALNLRIHESLPLSHMAAVCTCIVRSIYPGKARALSLPVTQTSDGMPSKWQAACNMQCGVGGVCVCVCVCVCVRACACVHVRACACMHMLGIQTKQNMASCMLSQAGSAKHGVAAA